MLRFAEEILLLLLDEERGDIAPGLSPHSLNIALAGAVLMDLALADRIDTDLKQIIVVDSTPLEDDLLDPTLADIAQEPHGRDAIFWLAHTAKRGDEIRARAFARLVERSILEAEAEGLFFLSRLVSRSRRYPTIADKKVEEVRLRVMRVLFSDDIPDPRDIVIICLADACGVFESILSKSEQAAVQERINLIGQLDLIGQSVAKAIRELEPPASPAAPSRKGIPHAKGLPLIGNALAMSGDLRAFLTKQYLELGPIFKIHAFNRRFIALVGPEANVFMASMGKTHFRSHEFWLDFNETLGSMRTITSMDGGEHVRMRKVQATGYARKLIENRLDEVVAITRREIDGWLYNRPLTGQYVFQRIVCEQLGILAANTSPREYIDDLIVFFNTLLATHIGRQRPKLMMHLPRVRRARKRIEELYAKVLAAHTLENHHNENPDFIDDLLELHRTDPQFLPETDLLIFALAPFLVGLDTVGSTCAFMLYALLSHPELLEQMTAEVDALFGEGMPTIQGLRQLDVTHRIALETLRMYPVIPGLTRTVANSFEFGGYTVPAGAQVLIGNTVSHHLPEYFPNPERFDIERYTPERAEHRQRGVYAPFGVGTHRCLGSGFAEVQIALTLATIVREAELALHRPNRALKIKQVPNPRPGNSFKFRLVRRRQQV
ncbi:MAG: cytochrome P450 [Gemmatimonadetes bacterium]|nr:cytochrome P450 [Gemmatimonadota bacterium]